MKIAITGSSGLIGSCLVQHFRSQRDEVVEVSRRKKASTQSVFWNPAAGQIEADKLEGCDAVIHLAGATISNRWTPHYKALMRSSRIESTRIISQTIAHLKKKPKLLISASAVGFYGNRPPEKIVDEDHPVGGDFLAILCRDWEKETEPAEKAGIRVVHVRTGVVLAQNGGALAKMLPIFNVGFGGVLGKGDQMMSWIAIDEIPHVIDHLIQTPHIKGPVNMVSPKAVSNRQFTKVLGEVIHRPTVLPVPAFGIRMLFGEMGQTLLLEGIAVSPKRLLESGYNFRYSDLKTALTSVLK